MPTYEYRCEKCNRRFSVVESIADHGKKKTRCPKCKGRRVSQIVSSFFAVTSKKS